MKLFISLALAALISTVEVSSHALRKEAGLDADMLAAEFESWVLLHAKEYTNEEELSRRMRIWMDNHVRIEKHNNQVPQPSFVLGHNEFSDMTQEEFRAHFSLGQPVKDAKQEVEDPEVAAEIARSLKELTLPDYVNWIQMGAVTPVKNQGACGSCWAFSTTGALEGAKFIKTGELVSLSEQNLLDCDHTDLGCMGGLMDNAFKFDEKSGGLCSEEDYPYVASQNECNTSCVDVPGTIVKTFVDVPPGDEDSLLSAIAMQPISVAIQADQFVFQFYKNGVLDDDECGKNALIDHGVLAVGYGTDLETQQPYWLVKNSWGAGWGAEGYIKLGRSSKNEFGMCAILKMASFPVVE